MTPVADVDALLFDLGGVLIELDFARVFDHWSHYSSLDAGTLRQRWSMDDPYCRHERGELDRDGYFAHVRTRLALSADDTEIEHGWNALFIDILPDALACVQALKGRVPMFGFSNSNPTHQAAWSGRFPQVCDALDEVFVSSTLGARKPEADAFELVARQAGLTLSRTLFFDDTAENVDAARALGMPTVHVRDAHDVRRALVAHNLL